MSSFSHQLQEIRNLVSTESNKALAYSALSHMQEQSSDDPALIEFLAQTLPNLIALLITDITNGDEEIGAQALKCLGFFIYHPSLVSAIPVDAAALVLDSLTKLIRATKMKSVCNLGVWCLSIQQFDASYLTVHFRSLLQAVVHAIDNPFGSLSTTFEAMQAVMKLGTQLSDNMRELSYIWAPPIYRRLLSIDKRERDMTGRCLLKITPIIVPPPSSLSKALVRDMKQKLLLEMKDLLNQGMKVPAIQAWRWFIRLLGTHAVKSRHLTNDMLKLLEKTFSDSNPQVQIASQVAWQGLTDALIHPPMLPGKTNGESNSNRQVQTSPENSIGDPSNGSLKSIKLIMTPLIGIIGSKCDISVHASCLDTWCHLLQKLGSSINSQSLITLVLNPILEAVFQMKPDSKNEWLWNLCLNFLDDAILVKSNGVCYDSNGEVSHQISASSTIVKSSGSQKWPSRRCPLISLSWDLSMFNFYIKTIDIIISHAAVERVGPQKNSIASDAALRIFRSVLKCVQVEYKSSSGSYDDTSLYLKIILEFIKKKCEDPIPESSGGDEVCHHLAFRLVETVLEELEPSLLGSPLYRVALDLKYIKKLQSVHDTGFKHIMHGSSITYMGMVSPVFYLIVLYLSLLFQQALNVSKAELIPQGMHNFFNFVLSSYDHSESIVAFSCLLCKHIEVCYIKIWIALAESLKESFDSGKDFVHLRKGSNRSGCASICNILSYPIFVLYSRKKLAPEERGGSSIESLTLPQRKFEVRHTIETWRLLYGSFCASINESSARNSFLGDLCAVLNEYLDENTGLFEFFSGQHLCYEVLCVDFLNIYGEILICIANQSMPSGRSLGGKQKEFEENCKSSTDITSWAIFASRFMKLSWTIIGKEPQAGLNVITRAISALASFVSCLHSKQNIFTFTEIMSVQLLQWLPHIEIQEQSINSAFQSLWVEMLNSLERSQPPIIFDSSFLKHQECFLEKSLDNTNITISKAAIAFWNSTYGKQVKLDCPRNILHVLDKVSRNGRENLHPKSLPAIRKCNSEEKYTTSKGCMVRSSHNQTTKRVTVNQTLEKTKLSPSIKRKRSELTEHQKEVRRAQQGREKDCCGHGPGFRTYTTLDFSLGNGYSQESQEI